MSDISADYVSPFSMACLVAMKGFLGTMGNTLPLRANTLRSLLALQLPRNAGHRKSVEFSGNFGEARVPLKLEVCFISSTHPCFDCKPEILNPDPINRNKGLALHLSNPPNSQRETQRWGPPKPPRFQTL